MKSEMEQDLFKVLVTEEQLKRRIAELGGALSMNGLREKIRCSWGF